MSGGNSVCERFGHKYYVCDVAVVKSEGKVVIHALCTSCGDLIGHSRQVTDAHVDFQVHEKYNKTKEG